MKLLLGWNGFPRKEENKWIDPDGTWMPFEVNDFDDLAEYLRSFSEEPRAADEVSKRRHHWFNPVVLKPESIELHKRKKPDVDHLSPFICVDIDEQGYSIQMIGDLFPDVQIVAHTTTKSRPEWQRWRIVIRLDRDYSGEEYEAIWRYLQVMLNGQMDEATKDYTRLSFMPAKWEGADNQFYHLDGKPWCVDEIVAKAPPAPAIPMFDMTTELVAAPDGTAIITPRMVENHLGGSGRMFKILCAAATNFKARGWTLTAQELYPDAQRVSFQIGHKEISKGELLRECEKAINHIYSRVQTETVEDIVRSSMEWAKANVQPLSAKMTMYHHGFWKNGLWKSNYVTQRMFERFLQDGNIKRFTCAVLAEGIKYGNELPETGTPDFPGILDIVREAIELRGKNDN